MGKGDIKTKRGKIFAGTYGVSRKRKVKKATVTAKLKTKTAKKATTTKKTATTKKTTKAAETKKED